MAKLPSGQSAVADEQAQTQAPAQTQADAGNGTAAAAKKKLSPKHKTSRGVPAGWKSTWLALDAPPQEIERIHKVANQRDIKVADLLQGVLKYGLEQYKDEFDRDAAAWDVNPKAAKSKTAKPSKPVEEMTAEELAAFEAKQQTAMQRAQTAMERAKQMLEAAKARQAATA